MPPAPVNHEKGRPVSLAQSFESLGAEGEGWTPMRVASLNDHDVQLVRLKGEARWRQHFNADEMYLVVGGAMRMRFRDRIEDVAQGAFIIVPAGVEHKAEALTPECQVVLFGRPPPPSPA